MIGGRVLDASAVRDITIGRTIYASAFLAAANDLGIPLAVPAAALQQSWALAGEQDYPFLDLLLDLPVILVDPLDAQTASRSGLLHGTAADPPAWDAAAAHAVLIARDRGWPVLTADPRPLHRIDPEVPVEVLA